MPEDDPKPALTCEHCASTEGVQLECSRTAYYWDGTGPDPNRHVALCRDCASDHHAYWDDMWSNVER